MIVDPNVLATKLSEITKEGFSKFSFKVTEKQFSRGQTLQQLICRAFNAEVKILKAKCLKFQYVAPNMDKASTKWEVKGVPIKVRATHDEKDENYLIEGYIYYHLGG